ncbi:toll/interleukin-1 receptor domain-containing adapter protein isoform X1 [Aquila chrysaetos chrysaetos]|uniref:TIR domain containing adaptor protein n=1 Tax=Aquila chrysaetos chrysaetos TaxID=223781 RepID=A0A663F3D4_AQUCH|nr:toll/interleukin-1 receptor domain-containing adapter protein isoform X1 [Aquila chrysaetos chrysaetos]XP_040980992.1 toll/interleukin-1 receptor domain-containing adapter protein isoform X1 [Aquila chrysaetos chrysaetos]
MTSPVTPYPKRSCAAGRLPCGAAAGNPGRSSSSLNPGADASPFPAPVPDSCIPGWFRRLLHKPKPRSVESSLNASRSASSSPSSSSSSAESSGASPSTSLARSVRSSPMLDINASGSARWAKSYDVCICHSEVDLELVEELVSYLEGQPESFRCFLQLRDAAPGSAVVTELCDAVQNSHCWVMLITPGFLRDPWCKYQMHQALAEAPMANGRTIPVLKDVDRKDYPKELRNLYYIYMALKENSFRQIRDTITRYLQELCRSSTSRME